LINYSYNQSTLKSLTHVDYELIANAFGQDVADALADGLKIVWESAGVGLEKETKKGRIFKQKELDVRTFPFYKLRVYKRDQKGTNIGGAKFKNMTL